MEIPEEMMKVVTENGYTDPKLIPGKGVCCICRLLFTHAIMIDIDESGYSDRYCFHTYLEAKVSLELWDGTGHPPGNYTRHMGPLYK